jgi:hypothetical protein
VIRKKALAYLLKAALIVRICSHQCKKLEKKLEKKFLSSFAGAAEALPNFSIFHQLIADLY